MAAMEPRELIVRRVAQELRSGQVVNVGIGLPTFVVNHLAHDVNIILQSENGFVGMGDPPEPGREDPDLVNAGGQPSSIKPGGAFFDSAMSFAIIRGGHVDVTVLGGLQVDEEGNLANWAIPGRIIGMGGAMDLVVGARRVIVAMEHRTRDGRSKVVPKCTFPLTATAEVDLLVTDLCVIEFTSDGPVLLETAPHVTVDDVLAATEAKLQIPDEVGVMTV
ncbi:MAG: 3-oxoacid CoA-transferase subunit B [Bacillota bacterium]